VLKLPSYQGIDTHWISQEENDNRRGEGGGCTAICPPKSEWTNTFGDVPSTSNR